MLTQRDLAVLQFLNEHRGMRTADVADQVPLQFSTDRRVNSAGFRRLLIHLVKEGLVIGNLNLPVEWKRTSKGTAALESAKT